MKKVAFIILWMLLCATIHAQTDDITAEWIRNHYDKREVMITMRDGIRLFTSIYEPKDKSVKHPIIMNRTCYGSDPYGEDKYLHLEKTCYREFARNGYIFVYQDVRGKNGSEGVFEDIRPFVEGKKRPKYNKRGEVVVDKKAPIDEASDTYDTAEWLVHNTCTNGNIGVYGISYPGFYSTMAALSYHPAIKAVSPQAPVTDWYVGDDFHHNGAFFLSDSFSFHHWFEYQCSPAYRRWIGKPYKGKTPTDTLRSDLYTDYLRIGAVKNFSKLMGDSVKFWTDAVNHPDLDEWWEARNVLHHCKDIKAAVMVVGGLFDAEDCSGAFATYRQIKRDSPNTELYIVEGPWSHGGWSRDGDRFLGNVYFGEEQEPEYFVKNIEYPFFAYYLEGKGEKPCAEARVFDSGSLKWYELKDGWPMENDGTPFYLADSKVVKSLADIKGAEALKPATYVSDPARPVPFTMKPTDFRDKTYMVEDQRFAATRPDVLVYQSEVLTDTVQLLGDIVADLDVAITTTDADFIVKVIDVFPDGFQYNRNLYYHSNQQPYIMSGYQMLVRGNVMRGKYRNSFSKPEPFTPNERTKVKFALNDVAHSFLPGHRIMVQIQSTWFPLVDRNPQRFCNIYTCDDADFQPSTITIYPESKVWLPVR